MRGLGFQRGRDNRWELIRNLRLRVNQEGEMDEEEEEKEERGENQVEEQLGHQTCETPNMYVLNEP